MGKLNNQLRKIRDRKVNGKVKVDAEQEIVVCDDYEVLTFDKFLKCIVFSDYSCLTISGNPSPMKLFSSWIKILSCYYVLIKSKDQLKYIKIMGKMEALNVKIYFVTVIVEALRLWYHPPLVDLLRKWGFDLTYSEETLLADLDRTMIELGNDNVKLLKMKLQYDKEHERKKDSGEIPSKDGYMRILYAIEKHRKERYPPAKITVYEFGMWHNELTEYNEMIEQMNRQISEDKYRKK